MGTCYELPCTGCNSSGWVEAATGESLALDELVTQLSLALQAAHWQIEQLKNPQASGPEATYQGATGAAPAAPTTPGIEGEEP
ncbi:hypothetical protein IAE39_005462 [Pseudomonas sp. S37]|nr:hypothetical protein [Pseudomonas sp. S37]